MKKKAVFIILSVFLVLGAVFVVTYNPTVQDWVEVPGTEGILYDRGSLTREGSMVYAAFKNENPQTKQSIKARGIFFKAAFYCTRSKVRVLSKTVRYEDGQVETDSENQLEANPGVDPLNESSDLQDISLSPDMEQTYKTLCKAVN